MAGKFKCRQCKDTGLLPSVSDGEVCVCMFGARLLPVSVVAASAAKPTAPITRRPTIYQALRNRLGRDPSGTELQAAVSRAMADVAAAAKRAPVSP